MISKLKMVCLSFIALLSIGCATVSEPYDFTSFNALKPRSVLVVPVVNESLDIEAGNYMLSTMPLPIAESGYYVYPVNTVKTILEQEGFYEPEQVHAQPPEDLAALFGADTVMFVTIKRWDAKYVILSTTVTVGVEYVLFGRDGAEIWREAAEQEYTPNNNQGGGLLGALVTAAVARAAPNYMPLARQANANAILIGASAIPKGPYIPVE